MDFLISDPAVVMLLLVVLEVLMTRVASLVSVERALRLPMAMIAGALVMSAVLAGEFPGLAHFAGIIVGVVLVLTGMYIYRGIVTIGEGRDPGPALDISVLFLSVLMMLLPPAGYALTLVTFFLAYRVRRLQRLKYKGLRVLA